MNNARTEPEIFPQIGKHIKYVISNHPQRTTRDYAGAVSTARVSVEAVLLDEISDDLDDAGICVNDSGATKTIMKFLKKFWIVSRISKGVDPANEESNGIQVVGKKSRGVEGLLKSANYLKRKAIDRVKYVKIY